MASDRLSDLLDPVHAADHVRGAASGRVTLVEYGDFECPFCARAFPILRELDSLFTGDLRLVFRHNPRSFDHPHAHKAAEAAEAAADQGKFWEMHDLLFTHQKALEENDLVGYATTLGLNVDMFADDLRSGAQAARVRADELSGVRNHVITTPTFFVNGKRFTETPVIGTLASAIEVARHTK
jgi:protein-disulfide isomerase